MRPRAVAHIWKKKKGLGEKKVTNETIRPLHKISTLRKKQKHYNAHRVTNGAKNQDTGENVRLQPDNLHICWSLTEEGGGHISTMIAVKKEVNPEQQTALGFGKEQGGNQSEEGGSTLRNWISRGRSRPGGNVPAKKKRRYTLRKETSLGFAGVKRGVPGGGFIQKMVRGRD